jgi:AmmeMemoRadiSam system protein B
MSVAQRLAESLDLQEEPVSPRQPDNAVELHLPFVKHFFPAAALLVLGVASGPRAVAIGRGVGERLAVAARRAVFVGSTDLTHYGPSYGLTSQGSGEAAEAWVREINDRAFLGALLAGDEQAALAHARAQRSACCPGAAAACMAAVRAYAGTIRPRLLTHYLSCDVQPADNFVGYGGMVL